MKKVGKHLLVLAFYCIIFFCLDFFVDNLWNLIGEAAYHYIYTLVEYSTFTFLLFQNFKARKTNLVVLGISLCFLLFQVIYLQTSQAELLDSIPIGVYTILLLGYIFYYFYRQITSNAPVAFYRQHTFWFAIGILIYLSGTFFFNILINQMPKQIRPYWFITYIFDIIKNILFTIAVIVYTHNPKETKNKEKPLPFLDFS